MTQKAGVSSNKTAMIKVMFCSWWGMQRGENKMLFQTQKVFRGNSVVRQIHTDCVSVCGGLPGDMSNYMLKKIIGGGQGNRKYRPGNAELARKAVKHANMQMYCVWCLSTRVNVSRDMTHSASPRTFYEQSSKFLVQNSSYKETN
jgi:hypothetical protein